MNVGLTAYVIGVLMPRCGDGQVRTARIVVGLVEVIEGRNGEEGFGRERVNPVGDDEGVALRLSVAQAKGAIVVGGAFVVSTAGVVGDLEEVLAVLRVESNLIVWCLVANDGNEAAAVVGRVMKRLRDRRGEAVVGARAGDAGVPGAASRVIAERELNPAGIKIARIKQKFGFTIALKSVTGKDIEDAVGAIADVRGVAATLRFQLIDILGINLRADIGGDF